MTTLAFAPFSLTTTMSSPSLFRVSLPLLKVLHSHEQSSPASVSQPVHLHCDPPFAILNLSFTPDGSWVNVAPDNCTAAPDMTCPLKLLANFWWSSSVASS